MLHQSLNQRKPILKKKFCLLPNVQKNIISILPKCAKCAFQNWVCGNIRVKKNHLNLLTFSYPTFVVFGPISAVQNPSFSKGLLTFQLSVRLTSTLLSLPQISQFWLPSSTLESFLSGLGFLCLQTFPAGQGTLLNLKTTHTCVSVSLYLTHLCLLSLPFQFLSRLLCARQYF